MAGTTPPPKVRPTIEKSKRLSAATPMKLNGPSDIVITLSSGRAVKVAQDELPELLRKLAALETAKAVEKGKGGAENTDHAEVREIDNAEVREVDSAEKGTEEVKMQGELKKKVKKMKKLRKKTLKVKKKVKSKAQSVADPAPEGLEGKGKKYINEEGKTCLVRKCKDAKAWAARRKKETPPPGGWPTPPAHWPAGVRVDIGKPVAWLPEGWGQGIKTSCVSRLKCYVSPAGKLYYCRKSVAQVLGVTLEDMPSDPLLRLPWAQKHAAKCIHEKTLFDGRPPVYDDAKLFATLTDAELRVLPGSPDELHWAVISARRATDVKGLRLIAAVQAWLTIAGANPVWYVDEESLESYKALGLTAKVGGKLVPARNMALDDAEALKKPCVQISDDISKWEYLDCSGLTELPKSAPLQDCNKAAKEAVQFQTTPVAAASFLLAKMRAARNGGVGPHLAGVFPLGNHGLAMKQDVFTDKTFILGDFFVADCSPCRFDAQMTLKEDYDYTCTHLKKHGSVVRANRLFIAAVHQTNSGGAVSARDAQGEKERKNIQVLMTKWPGVFRLNPRRGGGDTEVIMKWKEPDQ